MVPQEEPGEGQWGWETVREWETVEGMWSARGGFIKGDHRSGGCRPGGWRRADSRELGVASGQWWPGSLFHEPCGDAGPNGLCGRSWTGACLLPEGCEPQLAVVLSLEPRSGLLVLGVVA